MKLGLNQNNNYLLIFLISILLMSACNNTTNTAADKEDNSELVDSAIIAGKKIAEKMEDLSTTKDLKTILAQGWEYKEDIENLSFSNDPSGSLPFRSFYLSDDGTFVFEPRGNIKFGNWQYDDTKKVILLTQGNSQYMQYKIVKIGPTELVLINEADENKTKLVFAGAGKKYRNAVDNPYHVSNNAWRVAPKQAETDEQVKERLKAFVRFHIAFYKDNLAKQEKSISFYGIPTCIKWYAGGIILIKEKELPENWFACFYNKEQALQAHKLMGEVVSRKYNWTKKKMNWVVKNLAVLEQMYATM